MLQRDQSSGKLYGAAPVILAREVEGQINFTMGYAAPFGGIMVSEPFEGKRFTEEPHSWWEAKGFNITEVKELKQARDTHRTERDKEVLKLASLNGAEVE